MKKTKLLFPILIGAGIILVGSLLWLLLPSLFNATASPDACLEIPIVRTSPANCSPAAEAFSGTIRLNGTAVSLDCATNTLYIPEPIEETTTVADLQGRLLVDKPYTLSFAFDPAFTQLAQAVSENHSFTLWVDNGTSYWTYSVIFSTFPVLSINSTDSSVENEEEIFFGNFTAFMANGKDNDYMIQSTPAEWHIRGNSSLLQDKKSWRLSLKDQDGEKKNLTLAGLGRDDDWILNPMSRDDLNIRERLISQVWNQMSSDPSLTMSQGAYVELLIDGTYNGLYLLQRRIDKKLLDLNDEDILLKGLNYNDPPEIQYAMEIVYAPAGACDAYAIATPYFKHFAPDTIDLTNYADLELLINLCYLLDNVKIKNVYYLWNRVDNGFTLQFLLWDVDMSLGYDYQGGIFYNSNLLAQAKILHRREYDTLAAQFPDLDQRIAQRWQEWRKTLCYEDLEAQIRALRSELKASGALLRDREAWGEYALGEDTEETLLTFLNGRIQQLDEYYRKFLEE